MTCFVAVGDKANWDHVNIKYLYTIQLPSFYQFHRFSLHCTSTALGSGMLKYFAKDMLHITCLKILNVNLTLLLQFTGKRSCIYHSPNFDLHTNLIPVYYHTLLALNIQNSMESTQSVLCPFPQIWHICNTNTLTYLCMTCLNLCYLLCHTIRKQNIQTGKRMKNSKIQMRSYKTMMWKLDNYI